MDYNYPLIDDLSIDEIIKVMDFYNKVEQCYEQGIEATKLLKSYQVFSKIINSKSEEKQIFAQFKKDSGYDCFNAISQAKTTKGMLKL